MFVKFAVSILVCFLPLILGFFLFMGKAKIKPLHLLLAILLGLIAIFPGSIIQYFIPERWFLGKYPILLSLLKSLLVYGLLEEIFKAVFIAPLPKKDYSLLKFLCLSFMFGLSFCCFESVVYFLDNLQLAINRDAQFLYSLIFSRLFTSDIIHTVCAGLCGLFIYSCFCKETRAKVSCLIYAIVLHGLYDFFIGFRNGLKWFFIPVLFLAILECRIKYTGLKSEIDGE